MTADELTERLRAERLVTMEAADWAQVAGAFDEVERHDTFVAGQLLIVRTAAGLAAVEQPVPAERLVRLLADEGEAAARVRDRLETYDKMWDGCGCKVDYYGPTPLKC
jgi:hypothetical protein